MSKTQMLEDAFIGSVQKPVEVLVIDDDPDTCFLLSRLLEKDGMLTRTAQSKANALNMLSRSIPDVVITDIILPDGTGYELVKQLRDLEGGETPVVLMVSSLTGFLDKVEAIRCGSDGYFEKPVHWDALLRRLHHMLDKNKTNTARILLVTDDQDSSLQTILETVGYRVHLCNDLKNFESNLTGFKPDLILAGNLLQGVSGYELARYIRQDERYATIPIIFLIEPEKTEAEIEAIKAEGNGYITKPLSADLLLSTVASSIEKARFLNSLLIRDGLTRLLTRAAFEERARTVIYRKERDQEKRAAFIMIDLDRFKSINDLYGHSTGDEVLLSISSLLRRRLRQTEIIGRYGGEEFAIIVEDLQQEEVLLLITRLLKEFEQIDQKASDGSFFRATFSAGLAMLESTMDLEKWKQAADSSLYAAKAAGRNCVRVYRG